MSDVRWLVLLCASRLGFALINTVYAALIPLLRPAWAMSASEAGAVQSAWHAGYIVSLVAASVFAGRYGARNTFLGMGWAVVAAIEPMLNSVAPGGLLLLLLGGLAYTLGIVFYAWKRLPYHHAIWHGFVLAGSISHFFAILFYVIPLAAPDPGAPIGQR